MITLSVCTPILLSLLLLLVILTNWKPKIFSFILGAYVAFIVLFIVGFFVGVWTVPKHILNLRGPGLYFAHLAKSGLRWGTTGAIIIGLLGGFRANLK